MSVRVSQLVWEHSTQKGTPLIVLLALADNARDDGVTWPGLSYIGKKSRLSKRQAQRVLSGLVQVGELQLVHHGSGSKANMYRVNLEALALLPSRTADAGFEDEDENVTGDITCRGGVTSGTKGVTSGVDSATGNVHLTVEPPREPSEEPCGDAAAGGDGHLPGLAPPPPPPDPRSELVERLWAHYVAVFGDRLAVKELTAPRQRTLKSALNAVNDDLDLCFRAVDGLKFYRQARPDGSKDVGVDVVFKTGPHDRSNLTEKIEWWASQVGDRTDVPPSVPSAMRARVMELAVEVLNIERHPDRSGVLERGERAKLILAERFKLKVISDGAGKLKRFEAAP